jgi:transposase
MLGKNQKEESMFQMVTMSDLVPRDYYYRKVNQLVDFSFIREMVKEKYCTDNGRPSKAPELILRMMLIGYLENLSDQRLCHEIKMHAGYRWFCGLDFNDEVPDRTTLIKTRQRWSLDIFDQIFHRIVEQCVKSGLVKGNLIAIDGTQVEARAAINSLEAIAPVVSIDQYLSRFDDEEHTEDPPKPTRKGGDPDFRGEQFSNQTHRSKTDPDSRLYSKRRGRDAELSYLAHNALNVKSGVIVDTEATQANGYAERETALEFLRHLGPNTIALMDKNYRTTEFLVKVRALGVQPLVPMESLKLEPMPIWQRRTCRLDAKRKRNKMVDEVNARNYARLLNCKQIYNRTYRLRIRIEHKFAEAKEWHGLDRARGYGLESVRIQSRLTAAVQNIKRLVSFLRRSKPQMGRPIVLNRSLFIVDLLGFQGAF